jgi:hypothetical protein
MWMALLNHIYLHDLLQYYLHDEEFRSRISLWATFRFHVWEDALLPALFSLLWLVPPSCILLGQPLTARRLMAGVAAFVAVLVGFIVWLLYWYPYYRTQYAYQFPYVVAPYYVGLVLSFFLHLACWRRLGWRIAWRS